MRIPPIGKYIVELLVCYSSLVRLNLSRITVRNIRSMRNKVSELLEIKIYLKILNIKWLVLLLPFQRVLLIQKGMLNPLSFELQVSAHYSNLQMLSEPFENIPGINLVVFIF